MDVVSLPRIFSTAEIKDSQLNEKVQKAEKRLVGRLDRAAEALVGYGISRDELRALVEAKTRGNLPSLRKALTSE